MGRPKSDVATCRRCGEKIYWRKPELSPEQKAENEEAKAKGQSVPHYIPYYFSEFRWLHEGPNWEHARLIFCPSKVEVDVYKNYRGEEEKHYRGPRAAPKEYCDEDLKGYNSGSCNKPVNPESGDDYLCGIHWALERRRKEEEERRQQDREVAMWAREEEAKRRAIRQAEREKEEAALKEALDKKVAKLKETGLEFEIIEPPRRRSWDPVPNTPPPVKVTVDLEALLSLLEKERVE